MDEEDPALFSMSQSFDFGGVGLEGRESVFPEHRAMS